MTTIHGSISEYIKLYNWCKDNKDHCELETGVNLMDKLFNWPIIQNEHFSKHEVLEFREKNKSNQIPMIDLDDKLYVYFLKNCNLKFVEMFKINIKP